MLAWWRTNWGHVVGRVIGGLLVLAAVTISAGLSILGIGLVWVAANWFCRLVLR